MGKRNKKYKRNRKPEPSKAAKEYDKLCIRNKRRLAILRAEATRERRKYMDDDHTRSTSIQVHSQLNGSDGFSRYQSGNLGSEPVYGIRWPRAKMKKHHVDGATHNIRQTPDGKWSY